MTRVELDAIGSMGEALAATLAAGAVPIEADLRFVADPPVAAEARGR